MGKSSWEEALGRKTRELLRIEHAADFILSGGSLEMLRLREIRWHGGNAGLRRGTSSGRIVKAEGWYEFGSVDHGQNHFKPDTG